MTSLREATSPSAYFALLLCIGELTTGFSYFLAFPEEGKNLTQQEKKDGKLGREGVLELCHNWGTEKDESFSYSNGNSEPGRGFGHS